MIVKNILLRLVTVEEASIVCGGSSNSTPHFALTSTPETTTGTIMNADGNGKEVTVYEANNPSKTKKDNAPYSYLSLPPVSMS